MDTDTTARPAWKPYAVALLAVGLATAARAGLDPVLGERAPLILMLLPVALAAWYGGLWPGLFATAVGGAVGLFLFLSPADNFRIGSPADVVRLGLFSLMGLFVSLLSADLHRERARAKAGAAAARRNEQRFRLLSENATDYAIIFTDTDGRVTDWSEGATRILGWDEREMRGQTVERIFTPEDREQGAHVDEVEQARREGRAIDERWHLRKDGSRLWGSGVMTALREGGRVVGFAKVLRDMTATRRDAEERQRLASIVAESKEFIGIADTEGRGVFINAAGRRLVGIDDGADAASVSVADFFAPDDQPFVRTVALPALLRDGRYSREIDFRHFKTGEPIPVRWECFTILDPRTGQPAYVATIAHDLREQRRAEAILRESEDHYRHTVELSPQIPWTADAAGRVVSFAPRWLELTGLTRDQATGEGWARVAHPDDLPRMVEAWAHSVRTGEPYDVESRVRTAGGAYRWMRSRAFPRRDAHDQVVRWYGTTEDVHERRLAERAVAENESRFRTLADTMPQIVWVARPDGYHEYYNRRWYEYLGLDFERTRGAGWADPLHPDDRDRARRRWQHSLETGEPYEIEYRFRRADGEYRWFLGRAVPVRDEAGRITKWFGTCTDIEDRKRFETERQRLLEAEQAARRSAEAARQFAEAASRAKDDFLATISHELRTPLTAIVGWASILESSKDDPATLVEGLEVVQRNAQSQAQLIDDILDVSRITTGKLRLNVQPVDLAAVLAAAAQTVSTAAQAKGVRITTDYARDAGRVSGDPDRLQQVFWNLLANAIKFTGRGGEVAVAIRAAESRCIVTVADTGKGIAPEFLPHVFERFQQADARSTRRHGGLGLGLAIVRHLVEMHGGTVTAASDGEGRGSTFSVELPVVAVHPDDGAAGPQHALLRRAQIECAAVLDGARVLVLDDDPDARRVVQAALARCGAEVTVVTSVADALGVLTADRDYRAVVSDIGLPDEDGYAFIRRLRAMEAERGHDRLPAAALTAYTRPEDRAGALAAGFDLFIAKPVQPAELLTSVADLVRPRARA